MRWPVDRGGGVAREAEGGGGTCASRKERKSRVLGPSRTGLPGRNLSELGLGVPSVWMNIRRTHGLRSPAGRPLGRARRAISIAAFRLMRDGGPL